MAKSTRAAGSSYTETELSDPEPPSAVLIQREMLGGVPPSVGTPSTPSFVSEQPSGSEPAHKSQQPAQTTVNPLSVTQTAESDDARSTVGHGRTTGRGSRRKAGSRSTNEYDF